VNEPRLSSGGSGLRNLFEELNAEYDGEAIMPDYSRGPGLVPSFISKHPIHQIT